MSRQDRKSASAVKEVNERALDFRREVGALHSWLDKQTYPRDAVSPSTIPRPACLIQLDTNTRTVVESFGALVRYAKVTSPQNTTQADFQINVATARLATASEGLLRQIREVKLAVMLQDKEAMDREVDQVLEKISAERAELEKELEVLSNELKAAYAKTGMRNPEPRPDTEAFGKGVRGQTQSDVAGSSHDLALDLLDPLQMPFPGGIS